MALETRFARAPSGPVPYRVDGAGSRQLLIISEWARPYGEPGLGAFDAFAQALVAGDAKVVTLLDGAIEGSSGKRPDIERRLAAALQPRKRQTSTRQRSWELGPVRRWPPSWPLRSPLGSHA